MLTVDLDCEIRLNCLSQKDVRCRRGKQPNGACLYVKLRPPASYPSLSQILMEPDIDMGATSDHFSCRSFGLQYLGMHLTL